MLLCDKIRMMRQGVQWILAMFDYLQIGQLGAMISIINAFPSCLELGIIVMQEREDGVRSCG